MLSVTTAAALTLLGGAPQQSSDCKTVRIYFESGSADLVSSAEMLIDTTYETLSLPEGSGAAATIVGHIDGDEQARGLTSLDEQRVAAVRGRLEARRAGSDVPWSFTVRGMNDTAPARATSGREPRNRRAELRICPAEA